MLNNLTMNTMFYGDNLSVLRDYLPNESVDLIYLDPPFNSGRTYNVLFKDESGAESEAQIVAFEDIWHWDMTAKQTYHELVTNAPESVSNIIAALRQLLGTNQMMAYLVMMAIRLLELHRVLKPTGSMYLHCDPTASHYLKIVIDAVFSPENFRNEIIWRRTGSHNAKRMFGPIHDTIFFYSKTDDYFFQQLKRPYMLGHVERRYTKDEAGQYKFTSGGNVLTGSGIRKGDSGKPWRGFDPSAKNRHWAIPGFLAKQMPPEFEDQRLLEKLEALYHEGLVEIVEGNVWPTPLRYLRPDDGQPLQDIWASQSYTEGTVFGTEEGIDAEVAWLGPTDPERLNYPTQKPLGILERIIAASSQPGDFVLDPFCGCGTAIAAAQTLDRRWIGIDITHLSIALQKCRLKDMFGLVPQVDYQVIEHS